MALEGSSATDVFCSGDSDTEDKMLNWRRKGKEVIVLDVIYVDDDEGLNMIDEVKHGGNYKGKDLLYASSGSDSDDKKAFIFLKQSSSSTSGETSRIGNGDYSNSFAGPSSETDQDDCSFFDDDDDDLEYLPENQWYCKDEASYLQAQFEKADIPTGIEVDIPWWSEPGKNNGQPLNMSIPSISGSTQPILGSDIDQTANSHETDSAGGTISSSGFSCKVSLPRHHAASFVPASIDIPGGSSGVPSANILKQAAMTRLPRFEKFAVVDDYSDHHYVRMSSNTQLEKSAAKKIQDEWRILQSSLPDTIFVRVYESKMNLLRAVMIGPQGTPYHDGLYFFDIMFPSNYPNQPPQVHYHSGGLRLNPNLYATGKVCLSLLGTWAGQNVTENWIPSRSTLLQILVSIQALILNESPYFNEPGLSSCGDMFGKYASERYNEETIIKSLTTMIYSMKKPPKHFEEFVADHFITRSHEILLACNEYMKGARVGSVCIVDGTAVRDKDKCCSNNFKGIVGYNLNSLIDEFATLGMNNYDEFRVPASKIEERSADDHMGGGLTWFEKPDSDFAQSTIFGSFEHANAMLESSSSQFMSALFPTPPSVSYPFLLPPTDLYAAPYPPATPGDAYPIRQPSPLTMMAPPLMRHHHAPHPFEPPHMSSSSTPWSNALPVGHANPPVRFLLPPTRMPNQPGHHPRKHFWHKPNKPGDDDIKGNVHKWSDG